MKSRFLVVVLVLVAVSLPTYGQSAGDLNLFGFFQAGFQHSDVSNQRDVRTSNTFSLQQMNLFFSKNLAADFNAFVNVQFKNNFSQQNSWGSIDLEEAWMSYSYSELFNVKAGLLIPTFNNLNEIKNKTPLLPYIFRPIVYEATVADIIDFTPFLPERAFVQVSGTAPVGDLLIDYAVHVGNSERQLITDTQTGVSVAGWDTTTFKAIGGRVGLRWSGVKAGVSMTYDRDKHVSQGQFVGLFPRTRVGADVSYRGYGVTLEAEYIKVTDKVDTQGEQTLQFLNMVSGGAIGTTLDRSFYYGNVAYDVTDKFFVYGGYSYLDDESDGTLADGLVSFSGGAGFRPLQSIVVKGQVAHFELKNRQFMIIDQNAVFLAVSVMF